jgi:acyl carrier protein
MFGAGIHACLGRALSVEIWSLITRTFSQIDTRLEIIAYSLREEDYIFTYPSKLLIALERNHVISAIQFATGALNKEGVANKLAKPDGDMDFAELDLDSLAAMEMCLEIEDKTGIEIDLGDLAQHPSVNALAKFMVARAPSGAP